MSSSPPYDLTRSRLPTPVGEQASVVALRPDGHHVILGTAGSGKTVMAVLRAVYLAYPGSDHAGRTLLVTFNTAILAYVRTMVDVSAVEVEVTNYHQFARGYLGSLDLLPPQSIVDDTPRDELIRRAVRNDRSASGQALERRDAFFVEELTWISDLGIEHEDDYLKADRMGRQTALSAAGRQVVWRVRSEYLKLREAAGHRYDWHDITNAVCAALATDTRPKRFRHVVVDEGQDFSPQMLRSLVRLVGEGGALTVFADAAQQIYIPGLSWRHAGLNVSKVWEFRKNYRNSPQVAALALAIAEMPYFDGQEDMVAPDAFADDGPLPTVARFDTFQEEAEWVKLQTAALGRVGTVAVLFRRRSEAWRFLRDYPAARDLASHGPPWSAEPGVWSGTVHAAKGFEFDSVILQGMTQQRWPEPLLSARIGVDEARARDGRLLYVGVTRARQQLIMTAVAGELSSLVPAGPNLWVEQRA